MSADQSLPTDQLCYPTLALPTFGEQLRQLRSGARMSQAGLAKAAGVSRSTVRNAELGQINPSAETRRKLLDAVGFTSTDSWSVDLIYAPNYSPIALASELTERCNAAGGQLDQMHLYLDGQSASDWLKYANDPNVVANLRMKLPLEQMASLAAKGCTEGMEIVALGCGDGMSETRLASHLADLLPKPLDLSMVLMDISHGLLHTAYTHAADTLDKKKVRIHPAHGDFYGLVRYPLVSHRPPGSERRRIWTLLGGTAGNLKDELQFFRDLRDVSRSGDFVIIDANLAQADAGNLEAIRKADHAVTGPVFPAFERWLAGPLRRHCVDLATVKIRIEVHNNTMIRGAYELHFLADVVMRDGTRRTYLACRVRRYDTAQLSEALMRTGWRTVKVLPYGQPARCAALMLKRE